MGQEWEEVKIKHSACLQHVYSPGGEVMLRPSEAGDAQIHPAGKETEPPGILELITAWDYI